MELIDRWVHFRIRDIYIPDARELLMSVHGEDLLQGKVVDLSDNELQGGAYVVVEVEGIDGPVIVPAKQILGVL